MIVRPDAFSALADPSRRRILEVLSGRVLSASEIYTEFQIAQQTVDAIRAERASAGRFAVQEALMPYEQLLPPQFRGRNERIDERF